MPNIMSLSKDVLAKLPTTKFKMVALPEFICVETRIIGRNQLTMEMLQQYAQVTKNCQDSKFHQHFTDITLISDCPVPERKINEVNGIIDLPNDRKIILSNTKRSVNTTVKSIGMQYCENDVYENEFPKQKANPKLLDISKNFLNYINTYSIKQQNEMNECKLCGEITLGKKELYEHMLRHWNYSLCSKCGRTVNLLEHKCFERQPKLVFAACTHFQCPVIRMQKNGNRKKKRIKHKRQNSYLRLCCRQAYKRFWRKSLLKARFKNYTKS